MFEMTYGELFLFVWAVVATAGAWQWRSESKGRERMMIGASMFIKRVVEDDRLRDELRELVKRKPDADFRFGGMEE